MNPPPENHQSFHPSVEETEPQTNTMNPPPGNHQTITKSNIPHVFLQGSAVVGSTGPSLGHVDLGESENAYFFRVTLHGLERVGRDKIRFEIQREGRVCIEGVVPEMAISSDAHRSLIRAQSYQFCPPGPFSIVFDLPGQVDPRLFKPVYRAGILEVMVIKLTPQLHSSTLL